MAAPRGGWYHSRAVFSGPAGYGMQKRKTSLVDMESLLSADTFAAIDFETADCGRDSACALGIVRVRRGRIQARKAMLLRPPRRGFVFTYLHGISWGMVKDRPSLAEAWPRIAPWLDGVGFVAAHNAPFDRGVLAASLGRAGIAAPDLAFLCTVRLARRVLGIRPARLDNVCARLGIPLLHHDAASDAEASARIVMHAQRILRERSD